MKADLSRITFRPTKHYRDVLKQQGRVDVDADWNEQQAINVYHFETEGSDVIGACGVPLYDAGFGISSPDGKTLLIGAGRCYVDGILCENDQDALDYLQQPDAPGLPAAIDVLTKAGTKFGLVYLDVWLRHITALDDSLIRETALGGSDTSTRTRVVWQVKLLPLSTGTSDSKRIRTQIEASKILEMEIQQLESFGGDPEKRKQLEARLTELYKSIRTLAGPQPTCSASFPEWNDLITPDRGQLNARTQPVPPSEDLCQLPPSAGYQRLENQLYRVEIHKAGDVPNATFNWSRDNGSVVTAIKSINGNDMVVESLGPDKVLGFASGDWVEIIDDEKELSGQPGELLQIESVISSNRTITMQTTPPAVDPALHPKLRRWDQAGVIATPDGVRVSGDWQPLEDGIEVQFSKGIYKTGDYWEVPARTTIGDVEWPPFQVPNTNPTPQPPVGIHHHYCRLALVEMDGTRLNVISDCRKAFPPLTEISASRAMHVTGINWKNDDSLRLDFFLTGGLQLTLDGAPDKVSVAPSTVIVTMEVPLTLMNVREFGGVATAPHFGLILNGTVTVQGSAITWRPTKTTFRLMQIILNSLQQQDGPQSILMRLTVKGFAIWSDQTNPRLNLDGQAVGVPGESSGSTKAPRIDLVFPSNSGTRASDFQSWFFLVPPPSLISLSLKPQVLVGPGTSTGTVKLSALATTSVVVNLVSNNPSIATVPASGVVTIQAGIDFANFTVQVFEVNTQSTVDISASLVGVTKSATLTVDPPVIT